MPRVFISHSTQDRTFVEQEIVRRWGGKAAEQRVKTAVNSYRPLGSD
jgi:hypothetical protein